MNKHGFPIKIAVFIFAAALSSVVAQESKVAAKPASASQAHPDLNGFWGRLTVDTQKLADPKANIVDGLDGGDGSGEAFSWWITHFETDAQIMRRAQRNRPAYKPEFWQKIREKDWDFSRKYDPANRCLPHVPRLGMPQKIIQSPKEVVFLYENYNRFRIIPTDGRPHNPVRTEIPSWFGDSIGHYEGNTLVVETVSLIDQSWLGGTGYIHSDDVKVIERYRLEGDTLHLDTTVHDSMLMQPWEMDPVSAKKNPNPQAVFMEEVCEDRDSDLLLDPKNIDPTRQGH